MFVWAPQGLRRKYLKTYTAAVYRYMDVFSGYIIFCKQKILCIIYCETTERLFFSLVPLVLYQFSCLVLEDASTLSRLTVNQPTKDGHTDASGDFGYDWPIHGCFSGNVGTL